MIHNMRLTRFDCKREGRLNSSVLLNDWGPQGPSNINRHQKKLVENLVVAARLLLAANWKSENIPPGEDWLQKVHFVRLMDRLNGIVNVERGKGNAVELFHLCWKDFVIY